MGSIRLLDCTLRDGAYINKAHFGDINIKHIVDGLIDAGIDIIECGWLKNEESKVDSTYFHLPSDIKKFVFKKKKNTKLALMIDYNRYDFSDMTKDEVSPLDMIRVTFPSDHAMEGLDAGRRFKGYGVELSYQLTNAKTYADDFLSTRNFVERLAKQINEIAPTCVCLADTFGSMVPSEVEIVAKLFDKYLDTSIDLGFHSHNNMQLACANTLRFLDTSKDFERNIVVDSTLLGMGRGAGNTPTEVLVNYLNKYYKKKYNMDIILDTIDKYMMQYLKKFDWGYSPYYAVSGMMEAHINNVSYMKDTYDISTYDMKQVLSKMNESFKAHYEYTVIDDIYTNYKEKLNF